MSHAQTKQQGYFCPTCKELHENCNCPSETQHDHAAHSPHDCGAWGCPLWGAHRAGDRWYCGWHHRNPVTMADAISQWANKHQRLITAERQLANQGPVCWDRSRWKKASIPVEPNESYFAYLTRLTEAVGETFQSEVLKRAPHPTKQPQENANELPL